MSADPLPLESVCRLPAPDDNVAIAIRRLDPGTVIALPAGARPLAHTILEGHRFAVQPIARGEPLRSWGLPFGVASVDIAPGDYVCNQSMLAALALRDLDANVILPGHANFVDRHEPFQFDEATFRPGVPAAPAEVARTFQGYRRPGLRGVGTRNFIVILGTSSRTASFARQLAARLQPLARVHPTLDGIVAIAHTEGGGVTEPNNSAEVLRALAGFMVHPNVGAVLAVDYGVEPITNERLEAFCRERGYALDAVPHRFLTLRGGFAAGLEEGAAVVRGWLPEISALTRTAEPLRGLRVALQCGGSDAFSGVSGNPLAGAVVHEVIRHGGTGVLTETDEAIGAESYLLRNIRDAGTARALLRKIDAFRERLRWHGVTAESNPSAGNKFRGLYNIALKSLGAVHKKDPRTRIDFVTDYAEPLALPGFYFMHGPGNDLEGVAGQIAGGCNLVLFVTGNGSITNFPFVPTLKITTTTRRHELLIHEMDINAGRYLDGEPFAGLTAEAFEQVIATASGARTKGEHAGHSQVSIWRNWRQTDASRVAELKVRPQPTGRPIVSGGTLLVADGALGAPATRSLQVYQTPTGAATERVGLVLPTSLCSGQIARLAADRLNQSRVGFENGISRYVALAHTEGCGFGGESMYHLLHRTYRGYLTHPNVAAALLLEHGCEKVPNDVMRRQLESTGLPLDRFGWASVQLDGGIAKALERIERWFAAKLALSPMPPPVRRDFGALTIALITAGPIGAGTAWVLADLTRAVLAAGGSIVAPEHDALFDSPEYRDAVLGDCAAAATLAYGQTIVNPGFHVMATETDHSVENLTGLAAAGAHLAVTVISEHAQPGHPLIPVIQLAQPDARGEVPDNEVDLFLTGEPAADGRAVLDLVCAVAQRERVPVSAAQGFVDFQLTRGLLGVTT
jgi:altronate dehydratase